MPSELSWRERIRGRVYNVPLPTFPSGGAFALTAEAVVPLIARPT
jgi:hypothetical protein